MCIETYKATGKGLTQIALNKLLPHLKKQEATQWLSECYSQVLQATTLNLVTAYKNFFETRGKYPRFKAKKNRQSIQYPQSVKLVDGSLKFPGRVGTVKACVTSIDQGNYQNRNRQCYSFREILCLCADRTRRRQTSCFSPVEKLQELTWD